VGYAFGGGAGISGTVIRSSYSGAEDISEFIMNLLREHDLLQDCPLACE
jgi:hypothetical protein